MDTPITTPGMKTELPLYREILGFFRKVIGEVGEYAPPGENERESEMDGVYLNFVKVVSDLDAIFLLIDSGFFIQGGILCRSTLDACHLLANGLFVGEENNLMGDWLTGSKLKHCDIINKLSSHFKKNMSTKLNKVGYYDTREFLDDMVHGNYGIVRHYPAQCSCREGRNESRVNEILSCYKILDLVFQTALMTSTVLAPDQSEQAEMYSEVLLGSDSVDEVDPVVHQ